MPNMQFPANIIVPSLNGKSGFSITGIASTDQSGFSVSSAGDVNGDGFTDIIIGAPEASTLDGTSYVVFGKNGLGTSGTISLSSLQGNNGFSIVGAVLGNSGYSVSSAGDINADGIDDILIGAPYAFADQGAVYVVFGKVGIANTGKFSLSNINGNNGFVITGFPPVTQGGWSISGIGDINADGIADIIIGAPYIYSSGGYVGTSGICYVLFGGAGIGSSGAFSVSHLNGNNGFNITGISTNDAAGATVSGAGDVNGDGVADLVIGAPFALSQTGSSYVIFGKNGIASSGTISLSKLNGNNGFVISGFHTASSGGWSVSGIGDVNADGVADLIVGAPCFSPCTGGGMSYVIFGMSGLGSSGILNLSNLNGSNGFSITGSYAGEQVGSFVTGAGDINGDKITDFVVISVTGENYVVLGKVGIGSGGTLSLSTLTGSNGFSVYVDGSVAGAGDFNKDGISDLLFGNPTASPAGKNSGISYVIFGEKTAPLTLLQNQLTIREAQTVILSSQNLNVTNPSNPSLDPALLFTVTNSMFGMFSLVNSSTPLSNFFQQQIREGQIKFVHDGSPWKPIYMFTIGYSGMLAATLPQSGTITFQQSFTLTRNNLIINQGQSVLLTPVNLNASDLYNSANNPSLLFSINNIQHGYFALISSPTIAITSFTQAQITGSKIEFVQDGTAYPPSYNVTLSNGAASLPPRSSIITFHAFPILVNNKLTIIQGQTITVSSNNLSATDQNSSLSLTFIITNISHGHFELSTNPGVSITTFAQAQIQSGYVKFVSDGSGTGPSYSVSVSDGTIVTSPQTATITFSLNLPPTLINNGLSVQQGQSVILTSRDLSAVDSDGDSLTFTISNIQHGFFALVSDPTNAITSFSQAQIQSGSIEFVSDGGSLPPSYSVSVSDGYSNTAPVLAAIIFTPASPTISGDSSSNSSTVRNSIIGGVVSGVIGLAFLALKLFLTYRATNSLQKILAGEESDTEKKQADYYKEVIRPIVNKVFERMKTTSFLGYRSEKDTKAYISAIETIIGKLIKLGVDLNLKQMEPSQQNIVLNEIAKQIRKQVVLAHSYCSKATLYGFFKPEATPQQIEDKVDIIAEDIQKELNHSKQSASQPSSVAKDDNNDIELSDLKIQASKL